MRGPPRQDDVPELGCDHDWKYHVQYEKIAEDYVVYRKCAANCGTEEMSRKSVPDNVDDPEDMTEEEMIRYFVV